MRFTPQLMQLCGLQIKAENEASAKRRAQAFEKWPTFTPVPESKSAEKATPVPESKSVEKAPRVGPAAQCSAGQSWLYDSTSRMLV